MDSEQLKGVIPPLLTPLNEDELIDRPSLKRLVEHVIEGGVGGIFVLGSSGEGPMLPLAQKRTVVQAASASIAGRVPLLAGISDCGVARVREVMDALDIPGVDAFVATLPYYGDFSDPSTQLSFFRQLADLSRKPMVLYNIPQAVHSTIEPQTAMELSAHPNIIGMKDSLGDLGRFGRIIAGCAGPDFKILQGAELTSAASLLMGADGLVSGLANIVPTWVTGLYEAARAGNWDLARQYQERMASLWRLHGYGHWLGCLKTASSLLGLCTSQTCAPIPSPSAAAIESIRALLQEHDLI